MVCLSVHVHTGVRACHVAEVASVWLGWACRPAEHSSPRESITLIPARRWEVDKQLSSRSSNQQVELSSRGSEK